MWFGLQPCSAIDVTCFLHSLTQRQIGYCLCQITTADHFDGRTSESICVLTITVERYELGPRHLVAVLCSSGRRYVLRMFVILCRHYKPVITKTRWRWSAKMLSIFAARVLIVCNAGLVVRWPSSCYMGSAKITVTVTGWNLFLTSRTQRRYRIRQMAPTAQERATITLGRIPTALGRNRFDESESGFRFRFFS